MNGPYFILGDPRAFYFLKNTIAVFELTWRHKCLYASCNNVNIITDNTWYQWQTHPPVEHHGWILLLPSRGFSFLFLGYYILLELFILCSALFCCSDLANPWGRSGWCRWPLFINQTMRSAGNKDSTWTNPDSTFVCDHSSDVKTRLVRRSEVRMHSCYTCIFSSQCNYTLFPSFLTWLQTE